MINGSYYDGPILVSVLKVAEYIESHTNLDDHIYNWSNNAQIYYLTDRRAPIDFIWPTNAEATDSYKNIFSPRTKYVIVGNGIWSLKPQWLINELEASFSLETIIEEQSIYCRNEN